MRTFALAAIAALALLAASCSPARRPPVSPDFNRPGNLLIADQLNNRVIEIDPEGDIVWQFGAGPDDVGGGSPIGPRSVARVGDLTLVAAAGAPTGFEPKCPLGCRDNRVMLVDGEGAVVWQYGDFGVTGGGPDQLDRPSHALPLAGGNVLIADLGNHRVIEVSRQERAIVWQHGKTGEPGVDGGRLNRPSRAEPLPDGSILIADTGNHRAIVVDRAHRLVSSYTLRGTAHEVQAASYAPDSGNVLLCDQGERRVAEVDAADHAIWTLWPYRTPGSVPDPKASCVRRLRNGDTLICDQLNHRVQRLDAGFVEVASYGNFARAGFGRTSSREGLNAPADVFLVGE